MHDRPAVPERVRTPYSGIRYDVLIESSGDDAQSDDDDVVYMSQQSTPSKSQLPFGGKVKPVKGKADTKKNAEKSTGGKGYIEGV